MTTLVVISIRMTRPKLGHLMYMLPALSGSLVDANALSALCAPQLYVLITILANSCMLRSMPYSTTASSLFYIRQKLTAQLHILLSV